LKCDLKLVIGPFNNVLIDTFMHYVSMCVLLCGLGYLIYYILCEGNKVADALIKLSVDI